MTNVFFVGNETRSKAMERASEIQYKEPITIVYPGMVARVYIPILEADEREKRMKAIRKATMEIFTKGMKK